MAAPGQNDLNQPFDQCPGPQEMTERRTICLTVSSHGQGSYPRIAVAFGLPFKFPSRQTSLGDWSKEPTGATFICQNDIFRQCFGHGRRCSFHRFAGLECVAFDTSTGRLGKDRAPHFMQTTVGSGQWTGDREAGDPRDLRRLLMERKENKEDRLRKGNQLPWLLI